MPAYIHELVGATNCWQSSGNKRHVGLFRYKPEDCETFPFSYMISDTGEAELDLAGGVVTNLKKGVSGLCNIPKS